MNNISSIGYAGYNSAAVRRVNAEPQPEVEKPQVNFRANEYPNYDAEQKKKISPWWYVLGTLAFAGGSIVGLGYVHKLGSVSKMENGKMKDMLVKCEPAFKQCYEWCKWAKHTSRDGWDKVTKFFKGDK